eukprot:gnl/MRDRNA2_/MRDRNA2_173956_c0_seq1.p1 gnl/MRDRNA2_/MRDRNA2_173956_c0~~gnl/MRDRNA2_/MRDRNA2_173956_c0_seq1.p1  ORF type:complete len:307 (-),score=81.22 gnl/MRDRNA2_/MRDRNA2_173956_c0_seq1:8-820(-)
MAYTSYVAGCCDVAFRAQDQFPLTSEQFLPPLESNDTNGYTSQKQGKDDSFRQNEVALMKEFLDSFRVMQNDMKILLHENGKLKGLLAQKLPTSKGVATVAPPQEGGDRNGPWCGCAQKNVEQTFNVEAGEHVQLKCHDYHVEAMTREQLLVLVKSQAEQLAAKTNWVPPLHSEGQHNVPDLFGAVQLRFDSKLEGDVKSKAEDDEDEVHDLFGAVQVRLDSNPEDDAKNKRKDDEDEEDEGEEGGDDGDDGGDVGAALGGGDTGNVGDM